jgi:hypothetical protein
MEAPLAVSKKMSVSPIPLSGRLPAMMHAFNFPCPFSIYKPASYDAEVLLVMVTCSIISKVAPFRLATTPAPSVVLLPLTVQFTAVRLPKLEKAAAMAALLLKKVVLYT